MVTENFTVKFAETEQEKNAAYALRYNDMLKEYRPELQNKSGLDITECDAYAKQVICIDNKNGEVVGCYRIITTDLLPKNKNFVCESEFNISALKKGKDKIAELSRAVIKKEYRNQAVLMLLLRFIVQYLRQKEIRYIIGEASFLGTDKNKLVNELSYLYHNYSITDMDIPSLEKEQIIPIANEKLNKEEIKRNLPPLIRAYLSFGAKVSLQSFTDREFGSVDVFVLLDSTAYNVEYLNRLLRI
ncbi:MAG: GNAT family N-acetyltransferase [Clostridia bacterium]|nr:GNAT family N-acetyltransferase [Clostridia bacterium]